MAEHIGDREPTTAWTVNAFDREKGEFVEAINYSYDLTDPEEIPDFINQSAPTKITPSRRSKPSRPDELSVFIPDAQIPFHDEHALAMGHLAVRELMPDNIVILGDMMDFPAQSRFEGHPNHNGRVQETLDRTHQMLAQFRSDAPDADIYYIPGNHELRIQKDIIKRNAELLGIKRANAGAELGVLSMEFLLRCGELEVKMADQYPNGRVWLEDHLVAIHGTRHGSGALNGYLNDNPYISTVAGHMHKAGIQWRTTPTRESYEQRFAMSPGTLADITGSVPSYGSSVNEDGSIGTHVEDWQQAIGIAEHSRRNANPQLAMIDNEGINIYGKHYGTTE